jgi:hypothetical protein
MGWLAESRAWRRAPPQKDSPQKNWRAPPSILKHLTNPKEAHQAQERRVPNQPPHRRKLKGEEGRQHSSTKKLGEPMSTKASWPPASPLVKSVTLHPASLQSLTSPPECNYFLPPVRPLEKFVRLALQ